MTSKFGIKNFLKQSQELNLDELSLEEKQENFLNVITSLIGKNKSELNPEEIIVFEKILEICISEYNKKFTPEQLNDKKTLDNDYQSLEDKYDADEDLEDYEPTEKLEYCYPSRSYSISDNGNYSVDL